MGFWTESSHRIGRTDRQPIKIGIDFNVVWCFIRHCEECIVHKQSVYCRSVYSRPCDDAIVVSGIFWRCYLCCELSRIPFFFSIVREHFFICEGGSHTGIKDGLETRFNLDGIRFWCYIYTVDIHRVVFTKHFRICVRSTFFCPAGVYKSILGVIVELGVQIDGDRLVAPGTSKTPRTFTFGEVYYFTVVKYITELCQSARCDNHAGAASISEAWLQRESRVENTYVSTTADEVCGTMEIAFVPIWL